MLSHMDRSTYDDAVEAFRREASREFRALSNLNVMSLVPRRLSYVRSDRGGVAFGGTVENEDFSHQDVSTPTAFGDSQRTNYGSVCSYCQGTHAAFLTSTTPYFGEAGLSFCAKSLAQALIALQSRTSLAGNPWSGL